MAGTTQVEVFNCTPEEFYAIVSDYESYPEFLKEVKECKVVESKGKTKIVEYKVNVIKNFTYKLKMTETPEKKISWNLRAGTSLRLLMVLGPLSLRAKGNAKRPTRSMRHFRCSYLDLSRRPWSP